MILTTITILYIVNWETIRFAIVILIILHDIFIHLSKKQFLLKQNIAEIFEYIYSQEFYKSKPLWNPAKYVYNFMVRRRRRFFCTLDDFFIYLYKNPRFLPPPKSFDFRTKNMNTFLTKSYYQLLIYIFSAYCFIHVVRKSGGQNVYR